MLQLRLLFYSVSFTYVYIGDLRNLRTKSHKSQKRTTLSSFEKFHNTAPVEK